jgi:hypothetical protein
MHFQKLKNPVALPNRVWTVWPFNWVKRPWRFWATKLQSQYVSWCVIF